LRDRKEDTR